MFGMRIKRRQKVLLTDQLADWVGVREYAD